MRARFTLGLLVASAATLTAAEPPAAPTGPGGLMSSGTRDGDPNQPAREKGLPAKGREAQKGEPPPNPLNAFLADWMTAKDYALLKPGLQSSGTTTVALPVGPKVSIAQPGSALFGTQASLLAAEPSPVPVAKPTENPYLQALNEPAPVVTVPLTPPAVPAAPSPAIAPALPIPPQPQSKIPEFAKPATDSKLFKPLKRF
jgi:hypothetical protein